MRACWYKKKKTLSDYLRQCKNCDKNDDNAMKNNWELNFYDALRNSEIEKTLKKFFRVFCF